MPVPYLAPLMRATINAVSAAFAIILDLLAALYFLLLTFVIISIDVFTLFNLTSIYCVRAVVCLNIDSADRYVTARMVRPHNAIVMAVVEETMRAAEKVDEKVRGWAGAVGRQSVVGYEGLM